MTQERELIDGVTLKVGRREFIVPPLNLKGVKRAQQLIPLLQDVTSTEGVDAAIEVVWLALKRNYPDVTLEQLEEDVDLGNLLALTNAVLSVAGFTPKPTGELPAAATPGP